MIQLWSFTMYILHVCYAHASCWRSLSRTINSAIADYTHTHICAAPRDTSPSCPTSGPLRTALLPLGIFCSIMVSFI